MAILDEKSPPAVRAPGKAMLFGEYAVLLGAPALVAAVDRYATAFAVDEVDPARDSAFVREARVQLARELLRRGLPPPRGGVHVDSAPLYAAGSDGRKLGLGSSAAVTVAAFGAPAGLTLDEVLAACLEAHTRAQGGEGSGADVAAAVFGGVLGFVRPPGGAPAVSPIRLDEELAITLVDTGVAASTADRLARLSSLRTSDPARFAAVMEPLVSLSHRVWQAARDAGAIPLDAVRAWNGALEALAEAIGLPVVTAPHRAIAAVAASVGGAAKPSGAGGGDLSVCFTPRAAADELRRRLLAAGFAPLDLSVGARGLHAVQAPPQPHPATATADAAPPRSA